MKLSFLTLSATDLIFAVRSAISLLIRYFQVRDFFVKELIFQNMKNYSKMLAVFVLYIFAFVGAVFVYCFVTFTDDDFL